MTMSTTQDTQTRTIGVLGFGTMGTGIAQVCAQADMHVRVFEVAPEHLERGRGQMADFLSEGVRRGKISDVERQAVIDRVLGTTDIADLAGVDVVIEAVVEDIQVKRRLLPEVAEVVGERVLITSNTSALSVTELAACVTSPARFAGFHFFNPAPLMRLVEVVAAIQTSAATLAALEDFARAIGKVPVVTKDRPGFLVNRLLMPYLNQVIQDYDDGIAAAQDIDTALELGLGYPMGPLTLLDLIGLDNHHHATSAAYEQTRDMHYASPPLLARMVAAGRLGNKAGAGFRVGAV